MGTGLTMSQEAFDEGADKIRLRQEIYDLELYQAFGYFDFIHRINLEYKDGIGIGVSHVVIIHKTRQNLQKLLEEHPELETFADLRDMDKKQYEKLRALYRECTSLGFRKPV